MHIGVDATCWQNNRGYGRHARSLLKALVEQDVQNEYTFFLDSTENTDKLPSQARIQLARASSPTAVAASANGHRSAGDMWRMSREMSRANLDLLLFPTIYSYVPVWSRAKKIVMIHDVIAETYPQLTLPNPVGRMLWKTKVALGRWQADAVATVSEYSRQGIIEYFKLSADQVAVVGEASDPIFRVVESPILPESLRSLGLQQTDRFITYVGGFSPHKNIEALITALAKLVRDERFSDVRLVMVGDYKKEVFHSYYETIRTRIAELNLSDRTIFAGYVPDAELAILLNLSTLFVLPSLMEGFGLPAMEAAACGCPVIATSASPLPSLLGAGAIYFDPKEPSQLQAALERVLSSEDLQNDLQRKGLEAAHSFTWEAAARQLLQLIEKTVAHKPRQN